MSLINEIHEQRPAVRYALFGLTVITVLAVVGFFGITALQRDMFMALHSDPQERADFIAQQDAGRPKPLAALSRVANSLTASIGSLLGIDRDAGFDRGGQESDTRGGVHLLPLSQ
ncbi:MAG: hypothetical protein AAB910_03795 [Patescibacteria group bacterium]